MSLERPVLIGGAVLSHHEVERITHICGQQTVIDVLSWEDGRKEKTPVRSVFNVKYDSGLDESEAYEYVSERPEFAEYVDPNREAVDELLPILTDEQAEQVTRLYPYWAVDISYAVGERVQYDSKLYRCVQAHTSQEGWEPPVTPALWVRTAQEGEIPEWIQPTGAQDAYNKGDKVTHNGSTWESDVDSNVWEPGIYGWTTVNE